ncbi:hypothetical protein [uncultured Sphaerochaeta sp.]|uniref:hypothetical protein n=1 Tax=uncultured Sphaerochaeta sp. TaxID=886478 RepID=UPI002AA6E0E8|nr:hypothetical protein [uncultured Sphaerochaeta sp.]
MNKTKLTAICHKIKLEKGLPFNTIMAIPITPQENDLSPDFSLKPKKAVAFATTSLVEVRGIEPLTF